MSDYQRDDEIHPWNGHRGTTHDRLAVGCAWFVGFIFVCMIAAALAELAEHWWKGTL